MSACATWVIRTSWQLTIEIPTEPPTLRARLSRLAAVVRSRGASVSKARLCSGTKISPRPRPWTTPLEITGPDGWSSAKPVIIHSDTPISTTPRPTSKPRVDLAGQPARHQHRDQRADAARRGQEARLQHRIAVEILEQRRQQREAGEQQHAGHRHEQQASREIAVGEHAAFEQRLARGHDVDDEHPEGARSPRPPRSMISQLSNQSFCWPRSRNSCSAPIAIASRTKPNTSNLRR